MSSPSGATGPKGLQFKSGNQTSLGAMPQVNTPITSSQEQSTMDVDPKYDPGDEHYSSDQELVGGDEDSSDQELIGWEQEDHSNDRLVDGSPRPFRSTTPEPEGRQSCPWGISSNQGEPAQDVDPACDLEDEIYLSDDGLVVWPPNVPRKPFTLSSGMPGALDGKPHFKRSAQNIATKLDSGVKSQYPTKVGFASVPNEIIVHVWRQILDPGDVESFALTTKTIYELGSSFIREHEKLRARFSSIDLGLHPARKLKRLLLNPRAALYVRSISITRWFDEWLDVEFVGKQYEGYHSSYPKDTMELFVSSIRGAPFNLGDEVLHWLNALESGDEAIVCSLVLTILPNVRSLNLCGAGSTRVLLLDTIYRMSKSRDTEALSQLTEVQLKLDDWRVAEGFNWVRTFATLPSVKAIEASNIGLNYDDPEDRNGYDYPDADLPNVDYPESGCISRREDNDCYHMVCHERHLAPLPKTSAVTHLTFNNCIINTERLCRFLESLRALESFVYFSGNTSYEVDDYEELVNALSTHAKCTLRKLRLSTRCQAIDWPLDLTNFEVMEELQMEYNMLLGYERRSKLADILPPSVQKVYLARPCTDVGWTVENFVLDLTVDKAERLPNLRKLTIELHTGLNAAMVSTMKQKCEDVGVNMSVTGSYEMSFVEIISKADVSDVID